MPLSVCVTATVTARALSVRLSLARAARPAGGACGPLCAVGVWRAACVWVHVCVWRRNRNYKGSSPLVPIRSAYIHSSDAAKGEGRERTATEHTSRPGSSTAIDLRKRVALLKGGGRASCGARSRDLSLTYHTRGCLGRVLAPIDRRRGAEEEGGVGHGGAGAGASLHRED